jgi:tetratricopeptide (TPR) repeat protein
MKLDRSAVLVAAAAIASGACAAAGAPPLVFAPPPAVACPEGPLAGAPAADSAAASLARSLLAPGEERTALVVAARAQARRAVAARPDLAYGYLVAGEAAARDGDVPDAERMLDAAVQRCPELATSPEVGLATTRRDLAAASYDRGGAFLVAADTAAALAAYEAAARLDPRHRGAPFNAGLIRYARHETDAAVASWRRTIALVDALEPDTVPGAMAQRAADRAMAQNALLFAARQYLEREEMDAALALLVEIREAVPASAEAAYQHALALNSLQRWVELLPAARSAIELAPLSYGAWILLYNAYAGQSQAAAQGGLNAQAAELAREARRISDGSDRLPLQIEAVTVSQGPDGIRIRGTAIGTRGTAPVRLEFTLHGPEGIVGVGGTTLAPPPTDGQQPFELTVPGAGPVLGFSYRVIGG